MQNTLFEKISTIGQFFKRKQNQQSDLDPHSKLNPNSIDFDLSKYKEVTNWADFIRWTGEKNTGEMGFPIPIRNEYYSQLTNGFNSYLTTGIARMIINKMVNQIIGNGLRLESQIDETVLRIYDVDISREQIKILQTQIDSLFNLHTSSLSSGYGGDESINALAKTAFKYSVLGDCLVVLRSYNQRVTVQIIDGLYIRNSNIEIPKSHSLHYGIETNKQGAIYAFHVLTKSGKFERIIARDRETGLERAFLIKSLSYKVNSKRGLSQISPNLEKVEKMDRYEEATVKGEEERAKISYFVEHDKDSIGNDPMSPGAKIVERNIKKGDQQKNYFDQTDELCAKWNRTFEGTYLNLYPGSTVKAISENPADGFPDFSKTIFGYISGSLQIPPEVALSLYNSNYSASRAAIQDWGETVDQYRFYFSELYYKKIYRFWFFKQHVTLKPSGGFVLSAPGYMDAFNKGNTVVTDAYTKCRLIGRNRPFIDPVKEVNAIRTALGSDYDNVPLMSLQQAIEKLGNGDYSTLFENIESEIERYNSPTSTNTQTS